MSFSGYFLFQKYPNLVPRAFPLKVGGEKPWERGLKISPSSCYILAKGTSSVYDKRFARSRIVLRIDRLYVLYFVSVGTGFQAVVYFGDLHEW